jgi:hypothetical protein
MKALLPATSLVIAGVLHATAASFDFGPPGEHAPMYGSTFNRDPGYNNSGDVQAIPMRRHPNFGYQPSNRLGCRKRCF